MCGINGIISNNITEKDINNIRRMSNVTSHRGPDENTFLKREKIFVEFNRLSIVGLENGSQPFLSDNNKIAVFVNGEIYNFKEIKYQFLHSNKFKTKSDCEVILHMYIKYGIDFIKKIRGMFLIVIYDDDKKQAYFIRDRVGEKPLFFSKNKEKLIFCSELKGFSSLKEISKELINYDAIYRYLVLQYFLEPETPLKHVSKLPSGSYMRVNLNNLDIEIKKYWSYSEKKNFAYNKIDLEHDLVNSVINVAKCSDVPISVALSGGIDSSLICSILKKNNINFSAFTLSYEETFENDDVKSAKQFAKYLNIPLNKIYLKEEDIKELFLSTCLKLDEPIADIASIGYNSIFKKIREQGFKVVLTGHGVDELFWGYQWLKESLNKKKNILVKLFYYLKFRVKINSFLFNKDFLSSIFLLKNFFNKKKNYFYELNKLLFSNFNNFKNIQNNTIETICKTYLQSNGINQGERLSMANSLELRLPFIDYKFVESVFESREKYILKDDFKLPEKFFFKQISKNYLPSFITERKKRGFSPPAKKWFRIIFQEYGHLLNGGLLVDLEIISKKNAKKMSKGPNFLDYLISNTPLCYKYLILEIWFRKFFLRTI